MFAESTVSQPRPFPLSNPQDWSFIQMSWLFAMSLTPLVAMVPWVLPEASLPAWWHGGFIRPALATVGMIMVFLSCLGRFRRNLAADSRCVCESLDCVLHNGLKAATTQAAQRLKATREIRGYITWRDLVIFRELVESEVPTDYDNSLQELLRKSL